jgi:hypothetical protein
MDSEYTDQLDTALLDWNERDRAYEAWRDEFYPLSVGPAAAETAMRPEPSLESVEQGMKLHDEATAAHNAYLELRRRIDA